MHANIQRLSFANVQISSMFSVLSVCSSSSIGVFNVTDSKFLGNRDGIDIGQSVRYMKVSRSEMNYTGSWLENREGVNNCNSALKGIVPSLLVEDSMFAHNSAFGINCNGSALDLKVTGNEKLLLLSSSETNNDIENQLNPIVEFRNTVFYGNLVKNCSLSTGFENIGGGAVTVYGAKVLIKIVASTFRRNTACKGAGLYIGITEILAERSEAQFLSTRIIIDTCTFNENIAEYGAAVLTELTQFTMNTGSRLYTLIQHSVFSKNNASEVGASALFHYFKVSVKSGAVIKTSVNNCVFIFNKARYGSGIHTYMHSCLFYPTSILELHTSESIFKANIAFWAGSGIYTRLESCLLHHNSSLILQTSYSMFTSSMAMEATGIALDIKWSSFHSKSVFSFLTYDSTFLSNNVASNGAGILTWLSSCSFHENSYLLLQISESNFTLNEAGYGAGIHIDIERCHLFSSTFLTLKASNSTFISNTAAKHGAGIYIVVSDLILYSNSTLSLDISDSSFMSNIAQNKGAGVHLGVHSCSLHSNSVLSMHVTNSIFKSNTAEIGAGLSVIQSPRSSCIYGHLYALITNCRFHENSVAREGASLYFEVFPMTQVYVKWSVFKMNQALPGAGFYRQDIDFPTCNTSTFELKVQTLITTDISHCQFNDNINTAVLLKSKQKYGTLAITKCSFTNNWCVDSSYASEIFTELNMDLHHVKIYNEKNWQSIIGINSQSNANVSNVSVIASGLNHYPQIPIVSFSHLITPTNSSLEYQCPKFYEPSVYSRTNRHRGSYG